MHTIIFRPTLLSRQPKAEREEGWPMWRVLRMGAGEKFGLLSLERHGNGGISDFSGFANQQSECSVGSM
jgi:hypothetical protein